MGRTNDEAVILTRSKYERQAPIDNLHEFCAGECLEVLVEYLQFIGAAGVCLGTHIEATYLSDSLEHIGVLVSEDVVEGHNLSAPIL